ncbi:MAG: LD-carboxypeptidase [Nanoarchaeota archaeon]|nr:LD-carboxypeptidase [Nanoarchaeota archaeon]
MKTLKPQKLQKGDTIGVVSPSEPIENPETDEQFKSGVKFLENLGFKIKLGKFLSSKNPEEKAKDINDMFKDKSIKAIIASQGGKTANALLPFLDYDLIKTNPKIFIGISDITVLLNAINKKTGLITFHGNDVKWGFGRKPTDYDKEEFLSTLSKSEEREIPSNSERKVIREGKASGILTGGNLSCILKLAGTEYFSDFKDSILFLEEYKPITEEVEYRLNQLNQIGVFNLVKGIVIGHIDGMEKSDNREFEDILLELTNEYNFPILKTNDFGHNCPNTVLPLGIKAEIDCKNKTFKLLESSVSD